MATSGAARDTIAAIATPAGHGGIGIVRVSGALVPAIALAVLGRDPRARRVHVGAFCDGAGVAIDRGVALRFAAPASYTGEDVLELQGHGGPAVLDLVLGRVLELGARRARPGEFTERAFLNDRLDLAQAEAVADLIAASSATAARSALRSLDGAFSARVDEIQQQLTRLRMHVESALDFPEEEIDFLGDGVIGARLDELRERLRVLQEDARQGVLLRDGAVVVIAGRPNAGKSTLLNALAGADRAIVTAIAGTTRDVLREAVVVEGVALTLIDTAGLQDTDEVVEREGVRRARAEIAHADLVLHVIDATDAHAGTDAHMQVPFTLDAQVPRVVIHNKQDLLPAHAQRLGRIEAGPGAAGPEEIVQVAICAQTGAGLDALRSALLQALGHRALGEGTFSARRRHLTALQATLDAVTHGAAALAGAGAGELLAEDLRAAQDTLSELTGRVTSDDLLGRIFAEFCIGK